MIVFFYTGLVIQTSWYCYFTLLYCQHYILVMRDMSGVEVLYIIHKAFAVYRV